MTLLGILASAASGGGEPLPPPAIPTEPPWNATAYLDTPTPDGTGSTVHPSVLDFGPGRKWNGWRYWMAHTPFYGSSDDLENPCILVSSDGWHWVEPDGIINPIYPEPPDGRFNSDVDIEHDPRSDELVLVYRERQADGSHETFYARSADGITWPHKATKLDWDRLSTSDYDQMVSPAIIRKAEGNWELFAMRKGNGTLGRWTATSPEGQWTGPVFCSGYHPGAWHHDIIWDGTRYWGILSMLNVEELRLGSSIDGHAWIWGDPVITSGSWDERLYRPTLTLHENGTHMRVWYSARGPDSWRIGYTMLPQSLWPDPPA